MPFPRRNDPRYRETVPCISLRHLSKAGALKPGVVTALRWYEDHEGDLVMVCHARTDEPAPWSEWSEAEPVFQATISLWRGTDWKAPSAFTDGVEVRFALQDGKAQTSRAKFTFSRAGFGMIRRFECNSCDRRCDLICICLFSGRIECPRCNEAPFRSKYRNRFERALLKADRIRRKLGDVFLDGEEWP